MPRFSNVNHLNCREFLTAARYIFYLGINKLYVYVVVYAMHVKSQNIDGGATETNGGASAPVGPRVATPL